MYIVQGHIISRHCIVLFRYTHAHVWGVWYSLILIIDSLTSSCYHNDSLCSTRCTWSCTTELNSGTGEVNCPVHETSGTRHNYCQLENEWDVDLADYRSQSSQPGFAELRIRVRLHDTERCGGSVRFPNILLVYWYLVCPITNSTKYLFDIFSDTKQLHVHVPIKHGTLLHKQCITYMYM